MGLITNARIHGGHAPLIPVALRPGQAASILELLARMTMETAPGPAVTARHALHKRPGTGCIAFIYSQDTAATSGDFPVSGGKSPVTLVTAKRSANPSKGPRGGEAIAMDVLRSGSGAGP